MSECSLTAGGDSLLATYYIETPLPLDDAARLIASVQSIGAGELREANTKWIVEKHSARVIDVRERAGGSSDTLPTRAEYRQRRMHAGFVTVAFPMINFGPTIPNLLTAIAGEIFEMAVFSAVKLTDIHFPDSFLRHFPGPRFGITGCRKILGVYDRPIIGGIMKPCVGLSADRIAELAEDGFTGGLDFIKDDELFTDTDHHALRNRVKKISLAVKRTEDRTGERKMYAFNITGRLDRIKELHDVVVDGGGKCVMINAAATGLEALRELAEFTLVPIHCHRTFAAIWTRSPLLGISYPALTSLFRLCGGDQIHCGAIEGKLFETDDEVLANMRACASEFGSIQRALPVSSGGQWAGTVPGNAAKIGHFDFLHLAGAGTFSHPDGPRAGARSMRQAWDAVLRNIPLEEYAKEHHELSRALDFFGSR